MKNISKIIWIILLIFSVQFGYVKIAVANDSFNLGQKILPVCLVYLTSQGNIFNMWTNVSQIDNIYVVKFLSEKNIELPSSKYLFSQYIKRAQKDIVENKKTETIQFLENENYIEEIRTVV